MIQRKKIEKNNWEDIGFVSGSGTTAEEKNYIFNDNNPGNGKFLYRLKQIDYNGSFSYSYILEADLFSEPGFALEQNYPNPFNPVTRIKYTVPSDGTSIIKLVQLKVYNTLGEEVAELVNGFEESGYYSIQFDGSNFPSGMYIYKIQAGDFSDIKKMLLLK